MKPMKVQAKNKLFFIFCVALITACQSTTKPDVSDVKGDDTLKSRVVTEKDNVQVEKEKPKKEELDTVRGIDVSHFQGKVNWNEVKERGMHFGIAKATQGIGYTDPEFHNNWEKIKEIGLYRGTYHFYVAADDPIKQAEHFVNMVKSIGAHHLPPALDLEGSDIGGLSVEKYQENVMTWLKHVEENLGMKPMIYTNHPFGNQYLNNEEFSNYHLWIAEYGSREAKIPEAWKGEEKSWSGWQFTSHDTLKGVKGNVDESKFLSSLLIVE